MAKNWWFKFDFKDWRTDSELRECSLETKGFWIEALCVMHEKGVCEITGSYERLARLFGCSTNEVARCATELKATNTANVTLGHGEVTIKSRRLDREITDRESNRLRKQKERRHANVTDESRDRVKSNKKEVISNEEEKREELTPPSAKAVFTPGRFDHPAVILFEEIFGFKTGSGFATSVADKVQDLGLWKTLLDNKRSYADKPLAERQKVCNWILDEYDKRVEDKKNGRYNKNGYGNKRTDADVLAESKDFYDNYDEQPIA